MRTITTVGVTLALVLGAVGSACAETEQEIVNRYLGQTKKKHTHKISWISASFSLGGIAGDDYNKFAAYESANFTDAELSPLGNASNVGVEMGLVFRERFAWSVGGEYWLKLGESKSGSHQYDPPLGTATTIADLKSEIQVFGISTGLQYYFWNHPDLIDGLEGLAMRIGGKVGYYQASWNTWSAYENLNLSTSTPEDGNIEYKGSGIGLSGNLGADWSTGLWGLVVGANVGYQYLNLGNVAWYNAQDQEIVASYDGTKDGRVDLDFSGMRGRFEIKRFFSW